MQRTKDRHDVLGFEYDLLTDEEIGRLKLCSQHIECINSLSFCLGAFDRSFLDVPLLCQYIFKPIFAQLIPFECLLLVVDEVSLSLDIFVSHQVILECSLQLRILLVALQQRVLLRPVVLEYRYGIVVISRR